MSIEGSDILLYEKRDKIVTITLNRPERMNSLSFELMGLLGDAWQRFRDDDDAWVAILTGAGNKAFCAGQDLSMADQLKIGTDEIPEEVYKFRATDHEIWKPIVAAINGYALAGGWALAQSCDIRIAANSAELGVSETKWNQGAAWVCDLTRQINLGHALEIVLWGDGRISAQRGYEIGWINRVVTSEKLIEEANSWAERMLYLGPRSVRNLKEILYKGFYMAPKEALELGTKLEASLPDMEDTSEGIRAFMEKRKPAFRNR